MLKRIRQLLSGRKSAPKDARPAQPASPRASSPPPIHHGPRVVHRPIPENDLDPDAVKIVRRLTRFDHSAFLVGGCVRDLLLDRKPKDFDIGTSATPRQIKRLFRNCRIIGRRFRLAHIYFQNGKIIEVATFRALDDRTDENAAEAGDKDLLIRDDNVFGTPEEDALRRDFTINCLFYDLNNETVLDHAAGLEDLRARLVRTIGDPEIRFREDPIRSLRAIKFAARLDFTIEAGTLEALRRTRHELEKAASPRILEEINRFGRDGAARRSFELLKETGMFEAVLTEIAGAYADRRAWNLLLHYMSWIDERRVREPREVRTGEILSVLLLPLLAESFGWTTEGTASPPRGLNVRDLVDRTLRPLSLRLRVPRREQEACRQTLTSLLRMVPAQRVRRNTKRAILNRECLPDALWILEATAQRFGGEFNEALDFWRKGADEAGPPPPKRAGRETEERQKEPGTRKRRGRRGGRKRGSSAGGGRGEEAERPPAKPREDMPPPWDDRYFFAALPTVPEGTEEGGSDRYGAGRVEAAAAIETVPDEAPQTAETAPASDAPARDEADRPRRRRRRRRRRSSRQAREQTDEGESGSAEKDGEANETTRAAETAE